MITFLLALHVLSAVVWVGGMFFVIMVLRPAVGAIEPPPERPRLMRRVSGRFFLWVGLSVVLLLASGYAMIFIAFGGFAGLPLYVNLMQGLGLLMAALFVYLIHGPWPRFRKAVDADDLQNAPAQLERIRRIVTLNLVLGLITVVVGATGSHW